MALVKIQVRRDTAANWTLANPVLAAGEPGAETDTGSIKIGDGIRNWTSLPYVAGVTLGSSAPPAIGSASAGVSANAARADHSHALPANLSATTLTSTGNASVGGSLTVAGSLLGGSHKHTAEDINNFAAAVFAQLAASIKAGSNVTTTSDPAALTLTINSTGGGAFPLTVTTQPIDAVAEGGAATFTAAAVGGLTAVTYQWQTSTDNGQTWSSVPNAVGGTLALSNLTEAQNNYLYRLRASSGDETVFSQPAKLVTAGLAIIAQPPDVTVRVNNLVELSVGAGAGGAPISYQWQTRASEAAAWANVPGATQDKYSFTGSAITTAPVQYRAAVTALGQTLFSRTSLVTVTLSSLRFSDHPDDVTDTAGTATFTATATGGLEPIAYQWQRLNGDSSSWQASDAMADITAAAVGASGYDTPTLTLTGLTATQHLRRYRAVAVDADEKIVYSTIATLKTLSLAITQQPTNHTAAAGSTAVAGAFSVTATADGGVTYQWQSAAANSDSWSNISGATSATYGGFSVAMVDDGKKFRCLVTGDGQTTPSSSAALTVTAAPFTITTQPSAVTASGGAATFSFAYSGGPSGTPTIAWEYADTSGGWVKISGATTTTLAVTGLTPAQNGRQYRAIVSLNSASTITSPATVTVPGVLIYRQPANVTVLAGGTATFSFEFTPVSCPTPAIQWQVRQTVGGTWNNVTNATLKLYALTTSVAEDGYQYRASITCSGEQTFTDIATLDVTPLPITFTSHPQSVTASTGTATFTFAVTGGPAWPQTIQWEAAAPGDTWTEVGNGDGPTFTVAGLTAEMNGTQYRVRLIRTQGSETVSAVSNAAILTIPGALITLHPVAASAVKGRATFTMDYRSNACEDETVEWQVADQYGTAWRPISDASGKTLTLTGLLPQDSGKQYRAAVWCGGFVSYTSAAQVTVPSYEFFLSQPIDVNAKQGQIVTLSFTSDVLSMYPSSWESRRVGQNDQQWVPFAGDSTTSTSVRFAVSAVTHHNTQYRAVIVVNEQKVYTRVATVTVGKETSTVSVPSAFGSGLIGVAYGKGAFITISSDATVLARRSTDGGLTWANNFLPATKTWDAIVSTGAGDLWAFASGVRRFSGNWKITAVGPAGIFSNTGWWNIPVRSMQAQMETTGGMAARSTDGGATWSSVSLPFQLGSFVRVWSVRWPTVNTMVMFYRGPISATEAEMPPMPGRYFTEAYHVIAFRNSRGQLYKPAIGSLVNYNNIQLDDGTAKNTVNGPLLTAPFDVDDDKGPLFMAVSTDNGATWSSVPVEGMTDIPQQIAVSPAGIVVAVTGKGTYYNNVPASGNRWQAFKLSATATTGYVRQRIVVTPGRRVVVRYPWRARASAPFREPTPTTKVINEPITSHDSNVVAWVPGSGFVAGCDKYAVTMISVDGINWGGVASSRVIGEVPLYVVDNDVYGVDTEISSYEKLVTGKATNYPDFVSERLGVTGLTDAVNAWAHSEKEVLLLESGNKLTYIPRDSVPASAPGTPSPPLSLSGVSGFNSVSLSWTVPFSAGTSAVSDYRIEYSVDGARTWQSVSKAASTATSFTVTGLANYVPHVFRVFAINASGAGAPSSHSTVVSPSPQLPGAPTNISAVNVGPRRYGVLAEFTISWAPPASNGGAPITGYIVQSYDGALTYGTAPGNATSFTTKTWDGQPVRSTNACKLCFWLNRSYAFRVIATNAIGNGPPSASTPFLRIGR
jgi:hypothetical protein